MIKLLRQELMDVIPDVDSAALVNWTTLEKLPYFVSSTRGEVDCNMRSLQILTAFQQRAVVKESLRFSFGVPGRIPRVVPVEGAVICGQHVPPGVRIN
jgi:hypothetical protein